MKSTLIQIFNNNIQNLINSKHVYESSYGIIKTIKKTNFILLVCGLKVTTE